MFSVPNYVGSREVRCVFFEVKKSHPNFESIRAFIINMHGLDLDDPKDSTYELRIPRSLDSCKGFEANKIANLDTNDHIFLRISDEVVQYGTRLKTITPSEQRMMQAASHATHGATGAEASDEGGSL